MISEFSQVRFSQRYRIDQQLLLLEFERSKQSSILKGEIDFVVIDDLKKQHFLVVGSKHR